MKNFSTGGLTKDTLFLVLLKEKSKKLYKNVWENYL